MWPSFASRGERQEYKGTRYTATVLLVNMLGQISTLPQDSVIHVGGQLEKLPDGLHPRLHDKNPVVRSRAQVSILRCAEGLAVSNAYAAGQRGEDVGAFVTARQIIARELAWRKNNVFMGSIPPRTPLSPWS